MELDELKASWKATNDRIDEMQGVQAAMQRIVLEGTTKSAARRLMAEPIFELVAGILTAVWSGGYLWDHMAKVVASPLLGLPMGLVYALSVFTIGLSVRQLLLISGLDYSKPVVETQRSVAAIRSLRVRSTQFLLLVGIPLWVIFPLALGQALIGFELVRAVDPGWIVANLVFGVLVSLGLFLAARKFGERSTFWQKVNDIFAGTEVVRAQELLTQVKSFEAG